LIGLYFDPKAKDRQELISTPPHDVKPLIDLDPEYIKAVAEVSPILDREVLVHLINKAIELSGKKTSAILNREDVSNLNVRAGIMKAI
jgi:hypothetical protein